MVFDEKKKSVLSLFAYFFFFIIFLLYLFIWHKREWFEELVARSSVGLFGVSYAHDISHSCLLYPRSYEMPMSLGPRRLCTIFYFARWKRPFGKQALSGLPFTHAHALRFFTLSSGWQCCLLIVPDLNNGLRVSVLRAEKFCFNLLTCIWGSRGCWFFSGIFLHFVALKQNRLNSRRRRCDGEMAAWHTKVLFLLFELSCMSHSM